eukprot:6198918-Pleurochrysis_carterae.AAC.1
MKASARAVSSTVAVDVASSRSSTRLGEPSRPGKTSAHTTPLSGESAGRFSALRDTTTAPKTSSDEGETGGG